MKIGDPVYRGAQVHLPVEVIGLITKDIASRYNNGDSRALLWSCCLVSKAWYAASIAHLYSQPYLTNRNFDLFARTICPSVKSRKTQLGLEKFVKSLDMAQLAYESSNSLTARLLNRTRDTLEKFASPAVTFSIASLAPLSKCRSLHLLDLSADGYKMDLWQILDAVGHLEHLTVLKLPKDSLRDLDSRQASMYNWPKRLEYLTSSGWPCLNAERWDVLFKSWPETLTSFEMREVHNSNILGRLALCQNTAASIRNLYLNSLGEWPDDYPLDWILGCFPQLRKVTTPAVQTILPDSDFLSENDMVLEVLILATSPWDFPAHRYTNKALDVEALKRCVEKMPYLRRVEVPEFFVKLKDEADQRMFDELSSRLEARGDPAQRDSSGVFLLESSENQGQGQWIIA